MNTLFWTLALAAADFVMQGIYWFLTMLLNVNSAVAQWMLNVINYLTGATN